MGDKLTKLLELVGNIQADFATPKQVAELFGALVEAVRGQIARLEQVVTNLGGEVRDLIVSEIHKYDLRLTAHETATQKDIKAVSTKLASQTSSVDEAMRNIYSEIKDLKDSIPSEDAISHKEKFGGIEASVQRLSDMFNPESLKTRIESLGENGLDMKAIKGLSEEIQRVEKKADTKVAGRGGSRKITYIKKVNLTSQCDGNTKSFVLPIDTIDVIGVFGTQYPIQFDPSNDWTLSGRTLTLSSAVTAPAAGQTLWCLIEAAFYGQV